MLLKILLIVALIAAVYFIFFKKKPIRQNHDKEANKKNQHPSSDMVECASCGIYTEADDAIISNGKYYCSKECQQRG